MTAAFRQSGSCPVPGPDAPEGGQKTVILRAGGDKSSCCAVGRTLSVPGDHAVGPGQLSPCAPWLTIALLHSASNMLRVDADCANDSAIASSWASTTSRRLDGRTDGGSRVLAGSPRLPRCFHVGHWGLRTPGSSPAVRRQLRYRPRDKDAKLVVTSRSVGHYYVARNVRAIASGRHFGRRDDLLPEVDGALDLRPLPRREVIIFTVISVDVLGGSAGVPAVARYGFQQRGRVEPLAFVAA